MPRQAETGMVQQSRWIRGVVPEYNVRREMRILPLTTTLPGVISKA